MLNQEPSPVLGATPSSSVQRTQSEPSTRPSAKPSAGHLADSSAGALAVSFEALEDEVDMADEIRGAAETNALFRSWLRRQAAYLNSLQRAQRLLVALCAGLWRRLLECEVPCRRAQKLWLEWTRRVLIVVRSYPNTATEAAAPQWPSQLRKLADRAEGEANSKSNGVPSINSDWMHEFVLWVAVALQNVLMAAPALGFQLRAARYGAPADLAQAFGNGKSASLPFFVRNHHVPWLSQPFGLMTLGSNAPESSLGVLLPAKSTVLALPCSSGCPGLQFDDGTLRYSVRDGDLLSALAPSSQFMLIPFGSVLLINRVRSEAVSALLLPRLTECVFPTFGVLSSSNIQRMVSELQRSCPGISEEGASGQNPCLWLLNRWVEQAKEPESRVASDLLSQCFFVYPDNGLKINEKRVSGREVRARGAPTLSGFGDFLLKTFLLCQRGASTLTAPAEPDMLQENAMAGALDEGI